MSVDILGTSCDQYRSMVQYSFTSTETRRLVRTDSPGRPPRLSHSSWTMTLPAQRTGFNTLDNWGHKTPIQSKRKRTGKKGLKGHGPEHIYILYARLHKKTPLLFSVHSSGAVWESRWTSWAVRPNEPSGFRGRKDLLHRASALVTTCP